MSALPGAAGSRVVLIGVPSYRDPVFADIPGVANNVAELRRLFIDPEVWGLPEKNVVCVDGRAGTSEALDQIHQAVSEATDALVVYFAGHGLADRDGLRLMLAGSSPDRRWTALSYRDIRDLLLDHGSQASWKTVILDCCFAGAAFDGTLGAADRIADLAAIRGTCLLTACGETEFAWAPPGEDYTAFSGELIRLLGQGVADGPEFLDVETIYHRARTGLRAIGGPVPQRRVHEDGGLAVLGRNRAWRSPAAAPETSAPERNTGLRAEGVPIHINVDPEGVSGVSGDTAFFQTERALMGIDLGSGSVAWVRAIDRPPLLPMLYQDGVQLIGATKTSVLDPTTGMDAFAFSGRTMSVALTGTNDVTVVIEPGDKVHRFTGVSSANDSPVWQQTRTVQGPSAILAGPSGRPVSIAMTDGDGRVVTVDIRTGALHHLGTDLPADLGAEITGNALAWFITRAEQHQSLTVLSLEDGSRKLRVDDFGVPGLRSPVAFHYRDTAAGLAGSATTREVIVVDERSRAAAIWYHRGRLVSTLLDSADSVIEDYGRCKAVLGDENGAQRTRFLDLTGGVIAGRDRHFWKVDDTTAIAAPRTALKRPATSRIALLDVPTGRVTELGTVTTLGNAVWSRTHLVAPTPDGVRIWRYRD